MTEQLVTLAAGCIAIVWMLRIAWWLLMPRWR